MATLDEIYTEMFGDNKPTKTNLKCPVTGKPLWAEPVEEEGFLIRDPSHFYFTEDQPEHRYERHPFSWNLFRKIYGGTRRMGTKAQAYFRLEEDETWTELYYPEGLDELVPVGTEDSEIKKKIELQEINKQISELEYRKRILEGGITLPIAKKVTAKTIGMDLVPVQPMSAPTGDSILSILDIRYSGEETIYPYTVTEDNIDEVRSNWDLEKYKQHELHGPIQVGDVIDEWSHGGALSMRAGESVIRDGVEIYSRLTKMS